jgi:hypothetical protein
MLSGMAFRFFRHLPSLDRQYGVQLRHRFKPFSQRLIQTSLASTRVQQDFGSTRDLFAP